ncbi:MAG: alanine racemase [Caldisericia bacterium]|nr:alanine racemase [Caldisericia bacterium]
MHAWTPHVTINLGAIRHNACKALHLCPFGSRVWFVTKVAAGDEKIAGCLLKCGGFGLADSRLENLAGIKKTNPNTHTMLIRPAGLERAEETVDLCDVSLESAIENIAALGNSACKKGKIHNIIVMVEIGDLREGVPEDQAIKLVRDASKVSGINIEGIGSTLTCFAGVVPDHSHLDKMITLRSRIESETGISLKWISSGATNTLPMALNDTLPSQINDHRIGEGIILGTDVTDRGVLKGFRSDAFILTGEVIEVYTKPTVPTGRVAQNVSGHVQHFEDHGNRKRALLNFGMADVEPTLLTSLSKGVQVLGSTSDHTILDVEDSSEQIKVGSKIDFLPGYGALVRIMSSKYISKVYKED